MNASFWNLTFVQRAKYFPPAIGHLHPQMPSTVSDMYERGKQLAEEKDKAAAEASKDTPPFQVMAKTKEGDEEEVLVPSAASLAQRAKPVHAQQQQRSEEQEGTTGPGIEAFSSGGKETAQMQSAQEIQQQVGSGSKVIGEVGRKPLPVPQEQWDQSAPKGSTGRVSKPYDSPITLTPSSGGGNVQPGGREWDVGTKDPVDAAKQVGATGWRG